MVMMHSHVYINSLRQVMTCIYLLKISKKIPTKFLGWVWIPKRSYHHYQTFKSSALFLEKISADKYAKASVYVRVPMLFYFQISGLCTWTWLRNYQTINSKMVHLSPTELQNIKIYRKLEQLNETFLLCR